MPSTTSTAKAATSPLRTLSCNRTPDHLGARHSALDPSVLITTGPSQASTSKPPRGSSACVAWSPCCSSDSYNAFHSKSQKVSWNNCFVFLKTFLIPSLFDEASCL